MCYLYITSFDFMYVAKQNDVNVTRVLSFSYMMNEEPFYYGVSNQVYNSFIYGNNVSFKALIIRRPYTCITWIVQNYTDCNALRISSDKVTMQFGQDDESFCDSH